MIRESRFLKISLVNFLAVICFLVLGIQPAPSSAASDIDKPRPRTYLPCLSWCTAAEVKCGETAHNEFDSCNKLYTFSDGLGNCFNIDGASWTCGDKEWEDWREIANISEYPKAAVGFCIERFEFDTENCFHEGNACREYCEKYNPNPAPTPGPIA